jgi:4-hydroxy-tetrahydrodipicolinate synthase
MNPKFHGLIAFPITPTDQDGRFDIQAFRSLVDRLIGSGVHGLAVLGSTGAGTYFSEQERKEITSTAIEIVNGRVPVMIGTGAITTAETIRLSRHAESVGADAVLIVPVSYWPLTLEEVYRHFDQIAQALTISICVYNNPRTTQVDILPELAERLSALPNIDMIKETSVDIDRVTRLLKSSGGKLTIAYSRDASAYEALVAGAHAWHSGIANIIPRQCVQIFDLVKKAANYELAGRLAAEIASLCQFASEKGVIRSVHAALELMGEHTGGPRPPIKTLQGVDREMLQKHLTALKLID